jgi:hypothetical protein
MTFLGLIFVPAALVCFLWSPSYLLFLLMLAMPFEAGSIFNGYIGDFEFGVPPFYFVEICIFVRLAMHIWNKNTFLPPQGDPARRAAILLCAFWLWSVLSAFIMPHLFAGVMVQPPRGAGSDQFAPLQWNLSNLAQAMYLTLNVAAVLYALQIIRTQHSSEQLLKAFYWSVFIVITVGFAQSLALALNLEFPYEIFNNNPAYLQGFDQEIEYVRRINSTFVEPSYAGSFLSAVAAGFLASFLSGKRGLLWCFSILMVVTMLLKTTATTGLAALAAMLCVLLVFFNPLRKQGKTGHSHSVAKTWIAIGVVFCVLGLMLYVDPDLLEAAKAVTVDKLETISFEGRLISDLFGLSVMLNTGTLGAGLGSSRASSLITTLLGTVGIVGTGLFGAILYKIVKIFPGRMAPASLQVSFWAFLGLFVADMIAVPDLNRPAFWALMMLALAQLNLRPKRIVGNQISRELTVPVSRRIARGALPAN